LYECCNAVPDKAAIAPRHHALQGCGLSIWYGSCVLAGYLQFPVMDVKKPGKVAGLLRDDSSAFD
jgi:hypothetical protein